MPGSEDEFYGLTDRGPNVDAPERRQGRAAARRSTRPSASSGCRHGEALLEKTIPLQRRRRRPTTARSTPGEHRRDDRRPGRQRAAARPNGYDSEGLVALADGTFWVSDEYGPFITHFDRDGRQIGRLSPFDGTLPAELANRVPNKGMEGLTITPDGTTLVGMMQSALQQPDLTKKPGERHARCASSPYDLPPARRTSTSTCSTTRRRTAARSARSPRCRNTPFIVDERDGNFEPGATRSCARSTSRGATDIGPQATCPARTTTRRRAACWSAAEDASTRYVGNGRHGRRDGTLARGAASRRWRRSSYLDLGALLTHARPDRRLLRPRQGRGRRDALDGGRTLVDQQRQRLRHRRRRRNTPPPFQLHAKIAAERPAGRRRVPGHRHDQAPGGDQHRDGHDRRPVAQYLNWSTLSGVMSSGSPSRTVFDAASYFTAGNSRLTLLTGASGLPSAICFAVHAVR